VIPVVKFIPETVNCLAAVGVWIVEAKAELSTGGPKLKEGPPITARVVLALPPPGGGLVTTTSRLPTLAISAAVTGIVNCPELT